ncbi:MAG: hypothetical protein G4V63_22610 [Candidatus Afipia apatlaquensis]|uniref:Uncharacterized protein n=1 Tax=Candidatus Afipia apatlaquensis TaxID=2712852 RepID=A0A7C9RI99_9BRAD|nr:hypothetical protein [Candidatus Afipia apatlaquensis]
MPEGVKFAKEFQMRFSRRNALTLAAALPALTINKSASAAGNETQLSKLRSFVGDAADLPSDIREEFA